MAEPTSSRRAVPSLILLSVAIVATIGLAVALVPRLPRLLRESDSVPIQGDGKSAHIGHFVHGPLGGGGQGDLSSMVARGW